MLLVVENKKLQTIGKYNYKTIAVSHTNYSILKDLGKTGDSFNDVLTSVLKSASVQKKGRSE
jgi:predicted CopG family antitoxin